MNADQSQLQLPGRDAEDNVIPNLCAACMVCECCVGVFVCCRQDSSLDFEIIPHMIVLLRVHDCASVCVS